MNYDSVAHSNADDFQPYPGWKFQFLCDGYAVFYDPEGQLYHSIIPIACPASLYQEQFYEPESSARFISLVEVVVRLFRRIRASRIARYVNSGGGVLDIGCGNGYMLYYLRENHGVGEVIGTQLSATAQAFAQNSLRVTVKLGTLPDLIDELPKFSVITAWHVFEHVADYEIYLQLCRKLLMSGGHLIIEVPNTESWTASLCREKWMGWDPPHHVVHFTPQGLKRLLDTHGFEIISLSTFSLEYSTFTSLQSLCNCFSQTRNAFFDGLRRVGGKKPNWGLVLLQGLGFAFFFLPVLTFNLLLKFTGWGEVLHVVAKVPKKSTDVEIA